MIAAAVVAAALVVADPSRPPSFDVRAGGDAAVPQPVQAPPAVPYEEAERLARAGRTARRARRPSRRSPRANPDDFDSLVWLGRLLTRVGRARARRSRPPRAT